MHRSERLDLLRDLRRQPGWAHLLEVLKDRANLLREAELAVDPKLEAAEFKALVLELRGQREAFENIPRMVDALINAEGGQKPVV